MMQANKYYSSLLCLLSFSLLNAETIDSLLSQLGQEKALYKKTVDESAGIVQVFTRQDLDRMQVHTLNQLLKSARFLSYGEGVLGESILSPSGAAQSLSAIYRLYLDGHEVSSPIFGSAMFQFGRMDLGFVDHIEIYQGGNAIAFGNEPGMMTIRIYSKDPRREGGSTLSLNGDSKGSAAARLCATRVGESADWLGYVSARRDRRSTVPAHGEELHRDSEGITLYGKYHRPGTARIVAAHFQNRKDAFAGPSLSQTPGDPNEVDWRHSFLDLNWDLPAQSSFDLSADLSRHRMRFDDPGGIRFFGIPGPFTRFDGTYDEAVYKASLRGQIDQSHGDLKWGTQAIYKSYKVAHLNVDGHPGPAQSGPSDMTILSAYAEESWHTDPANLLIGTLKLDYLRNDEDRQDTEYSLRLGWIHLFSMEHSFKLFYNRTYLYPGFGYTSSYPKPFAPNPNLGAEHFQNLIGEWKYETGRHRFQVGGIWQQKRDAIVIDLRRNTFANSSRVIDVTKAYLDYTYTFDEHHRLELEYYRGWFLDDVTAGSSIAGGALRLFDSWGDWDLYNELVYRQGYTFPLPQQLGGPIPVRNGWDYTVALQWHPRHDLTLSLKGENLLNHALESPVYGLGAVPIFDRKVSFGVEYFF